MNTVVVIGNQEDSVHMGSQQGILLTPRKGCSPLFRAKDSFFRFI